MIDLIIVRTTRILIRVVLITQRAPGDPEEGDLPGVRADQADLVDTATQGDLVTQDLMAATEGTGDVGAETMVTNQTNGIED